MPVLMELNRILVRAEPFGVGPGKLDPRLIKPLDLDIRIVMTWYGGTRGIGLRVTEPSGEKASAEHSTTKIGGLFGGNLWQGDGPNEYLVHRAMKGIYEIEAENRTDPNPNNPRLMPVTVQIDIFTNYGRRDEQCRSTMVQLNEKQTTGVGHIRF